MLAITATASWWFLPSKIEGFCLPLIEALRCGSRGLVLGTFPSCAKLAVSRCSYFDLAARNPIEALAIAIKDFAYEGPKPQPLALPQFGAGEIARQYTALYRCLIEGQAPSVLDIQGHQRHRP